MSTTTTDTEEAAPEEMGEFTVSDELYEISEATNSDGTVDVTVYDFEKTDNGKVRVMFHTPTHKKKGELMEWPKKDSVDYKFVRLCRKTVGSLSGAKWLKTDGAEIKADPESWEIKADLSKSDEVKESIRNTTANDIVELSGVALLILWAVGISVIVLFAPIIGAATLAGVTAPMVGLWKLWLPAFIAMIVTYTMIPEQ